MDYLPARTALPASVLPRSHAPEVTDYRKYRDCVRWDFGFTCAVCFLHEQDLVEGGADGAGLVWIEHHELKHGSSEKRDDYRNCLLSCRFCNNGRSKIPAVSKTGDARLLDPTKDVWALHFQIRGHAMEVLKKGADADYTFETYALGSQRKSALRENRARRFAEVARARQKVEELVPRLMERAKRTTNPNEKRDCIEAARGLEQGYRAALAEVQRYEAVPSDAPSSCLCGQRRELPEWLRAQLQVMDTSVPTAGQ